ncbi:MAG TPA: DUF4087 domain-containing protein [Burkholderiales bacterium]|nr:DUF4087 domain-containing protein [Burkholderiales bacterium]
MRSSVAALALATGAFRSAATLIVALATVGATDARADAPAVLRCGWFENPTPGNATLADRDGEWTIGMQGGNQAEGDWPRFRKGEWVATNRSYGHGCACLKVVADPATREVKRIVSAKARPLKACREDKALKEPGG